jgi:hypothetical protein
MSQLAKGTKVKVIRDTEDPNSGWVGASGVIDHYNVFDNDYTILVESGNPNPDDGNFAWFGRDELEVLK